MTNGNPQDEESEGLSQQANPVILIGDPRSLRGELHWHNSGSEKIVLRNALVQNAHATNVPINLATDEAAAQPKLNAPVSLAATIQPGQSQRVSLTFDLGQHTPPGEYRGELKIGESTRPVIMHVAETVRLRVSPSQIVVDAGPGATVLKRVMVSNEGNVPLTMGNFGTIALGEELMLCLGARSSIAAGDGGKKALEELFAEIIRDDAGAVTRPAGSLEVHNAAASFTLQPGEVRPLDLEIRLPDKLEANSRYRSRLPIYTAELEFVIVPISDGKGTEKPVSPSISKTS